MSLPNAKTCKQCGELRPIEQFRKYYGSRKGSYKVCLACEKINSRAKYLRRKGEAMNHAEEAELEKIEKLYEMQRAAGLQPPRDHLGCKTSLAESLDGMIEKYSQQAASLQGVVPAAQTISIPAELAKWLTEPLTEAPEYYQDEVYEQLKAKYRPQLRIDTDTMMPVYDDTYKGVLDKILDRFDAYEDEYYDKE